MDAKNTAHKSLNGKGKIMILSAVLLLLAGVLWLRRKETQKVTTLPRPAAGEIDQEVSLDVRLKDTGQTWNWKGTVTSRRYSEEELTNQMEQAEEYIRTNLTQEGESMDQVVSSLHLMSSVPGTSVEVEWEWQEKDLIDWEGNVIQEKLAGETIVILTAQLQCQDLTKLLQLQVCLVPEKLEKEEIRKRELTEELCSLASSQKEEEDIFLPSEWDGISVDYFITTENYYWLFPCMLFGVLLFYKAHGREEEKKKEQKRKEDIMLEYPDFVSKFVVLMGAGMSLSAVWIRLDEEYSQKEQTKKEQVCAFGEEIKMVVQKLRNGEPERQVYDFFGKHSGVPACAKFASILTQNLRMGSERVLEQLEYEAAQALEDRKAQARKRGEEMETKLLLPMMLQLAIIMVMVMVPAFMSM